LVLTNDAERATTTAGQAAELNATDVYREHADFVWRSLQHLGVRPPDLEDVTQEVFVVVHRKLATFDGSSRITTWLFGICLRVADRHRRRAHFRYEQRGHDPPERVDDHTPEDRLAERQKQALLQRALDHLSLEHRAVFVLFELEGRPCAEIAELLTVPVGTVHSRLHNARREILAAIAVRDSQRPNRGSGGWP
jgi:RNA polymerase sigma-70 factor (ECF subfamily)